MDDLQSLIRIPNVWDSLTRVEERLLEASAADDPYLTKIAQHLLLAGGKRFRPLLALLAAEFGPARDGRPVEAGVSVELIHVGSLYHDDVIDEADVRRGAASVNANWSNTVAILAGLIGWFVLGPTSAVLHRLAFQKPISGQSKFATRLAGALIVAALAFFFIPLGGGRGPGRSRGRRRRRPPRWRP